MLLITGSFYKESSKWGGQGTEGGLDRMSYIAIDLVSMGGRSSEIVQEGRNSDIGILLFCF